MTLIDAWRALFPDADPARVDATCSHLLTRWSEPQRHYHTTDHLAFMLSVVDAAAARGAGPADLTAVRLAAWFHDAIYDPRGTDNEARSAALASEALPALGTGEGTVAEVGRLVLVTADHAVAEGDASGALLVDADLAILGADPARYRAYTEAVRREYAFVPDDAFRAGRAAVLHRILSLPTLYHLAEHRAAWNARARANLAGKLATLA